MTDKIILGTVQFGLNYGIHNSGGKPSIDAVIDILNKAHDNNITLLDSAEAYGDAHEKIGVFHEKSTSRFRVVTKYSSARKDLPDDIEKRVLKNLLDLHVDSLYAYMFHSFGDFEKNYPRFESQISQLKKKGLIGKFGVSVYTNEELDKVISYEGVDIVQMPFNLLDNISQRGDAIKRAKQKGLEIHTRSTFLQGLFFEEIKTLPGKFSPLISYLERINEVSRVSGIQLSDLALQYCSRQDMIDYVLIGVDNVLQLEKNIQALHNEIPVKILQEVDSIRVESPKMLNPSNWNL